MYSYSSINFFHLQIVKVGREIFRNFSPHLFSLFFFFDREAGLEGWEGDTHGDVPFQLSTIVIWGSHILAKLNAKQMFSILGYVLPRCKNSFFFSEMWNKIKLLYKILERTPCFLMVTGISQQQTKTTVSVQSVKTFVFCIPHLCLFLRSNYTLIRFLIKLLNMTSQFGPILSSLLCHKRF